MNVERHSRKCQACKHPDSEDIHRDFMASVACFQLDKKYELADGCARRHALAMGWFEERQKSSVGTLDRFIQEGLAKGKVDAVKVSGANVLKAMELKAKITGELVERRQQIATEVQEIMEDLEGRTVEELEFYKLRGRWPEVSEIGREDARVQ